MPTKKNPKTEAITMIRYALALTSWSPAQLATDRHTPGPITFSSESEAQSEARYRESVGLEAGVPVKIKITFQTP